jgi:hypothetical protein
MGIHLQQNKDQYTKSQQGRASITEKGQGYSDYGEKPNGHTDIHGKMKKQDTGYTVAVNPGKA